MNDENNDNISEEDISKWAARLTPEGSPGLMAQRMREYLGDQGYEKAVAQNDAAVTLHLQRETVINNILSVVAVFGVLFGFVALVASVALVVKFIF